MKASSLEKECERVKKALSERLEAHDKSRSAAQGKLEEICKGIETSITELENKISGELEEKSTAESNRLQSALDALQMDGNDTTKAVQRANAELLVVQSYDVTESNTKKRGKPKFNASSLYELRTERGVVAEVVEGLRPTDVRASKSGKKKKVSLRFSCLCPEELEVLSELGIEKALKYKCLFAKKGESKGRQYVLKAESDGSFTFTPSSIKAGTA